MTSVYDFHLPDFTFKLSNHAKYPKGLVPYYTLSFFTLSLINLLFKFVVNLWSTYSHADLEQKSTIDFVIHRSSIKICDQLVHMQILNKNPQIIWLLIALPSESAIILFIHRSFTKIWDWLGHLQRIFFNDLWSLKNNWSWKKSKVW